MYVSVSYFSQISVQEVRIIIINTFLFIRNIWYKYMMINDWIK